MHQPSYAKGMFNQYGQYPGMPGSPGGPGGPGFGLMSQQGTGMPGHQYTTSPMKGAHVDEELHGRKVPSQYYTILNDRIDQLKEELMMTKQRIAAGGGAGGGIGGGEADD